MSTRYYIATHRNGQVFTRSTESRVYTHMVAATDDIGGTWGAWGWSGSLELAQKNMRSCHLRASDILEAVEVDRKTFEAAKGGKVTQPATVEPREAPKVDRSALTTREAWLLAFTDLSRPTFIEAGAELPQAVRVSVGHPSKGVRSNVIGECWSHANSADGAVEIFIRPTLQSDSSRVADVLTHELIHAALGVAEGHGATFRRVMKRLGLTGKATATTAGPDWHAWADPILEALGPLPGAQLHDAALAGGKKTQTTRYLKVTCGCCGWQARVTAKHLEGRTLRCPDEDCEGQLEQAA